MMNGSIICKPLLWMEGLPELVSPTFKVRVPLENVPISEGKEVTKSVPLITIHKAATLSKASTIYSTEI